MTGVQTCALPISALALNDAAELGLRQGLTIEGALANAYEPPAPQPPENKEGADIEGTEGTEAAGTEGGKVTLSYAAVREQLDKATTRDGLDQAAASIDLVVNLTQQKELTAIYKERKAALEA